jgi:excisionase family DNA binding protein
MQPIKRSEQTQLARQDGTAAKVPALRLADEETGAISGLVRLLARQACREGLADPASPGSSGESTPDSPESCPTDFPKIFHQKPGE